MKAFVATCVLAATLGAAGSAQAFDVTPGVYGQFAVGAANGSNPNYDGSSSLSIAYDLGYRFTPNLGAEVFFRGLNFDILQPTRDYAYPERHIGVAMTGSWPLWGILNGTARLGVGQTTLKRDNGPDSHKTSLSGGAGLALQLGPNMALTTGYERYASVNVNVWNVGWELRY